MRVKVGRRRLSVVIAAPFRVTFSALVLTLSMTAVTLFAGAGRAQGAWQRPVDVLGRPLDTAAFLYECEQPPCGTESGVNGIFRMVGQRAGVGLITVPTPIVVDVDGYPAPAGAKPSINNDYRYVDESPLYGVSLSGGRWSVTPLGAAPWLDSWDLPSADIAPDGRGGAMVVYQSASGSRTEGPSVWARQFTGGAWQPPTRLAGPFRPGTGTASHAPRVVALPSGNMVAFYSDSISAQYTTTVVRRWDPTQGWHPYEIAELGPVWPDSLSAATGPDGSITLAYARVLPTVGSSQPGQLAARAVGGGSGVGPRADGELRPVIGQTRTVAGSGGSALVVSTGLDAGLHAQALNGGAFAAPVNVAPGYLPGDDYFALWGDPQSADLVWAQGGFPETGSLDPSKRRIYRATLSAGGWGAPQPIDGGLPSPAPVSLDLTADIAAGGGQVVFTAGKLTVGEGFERNEQRVYATQLTSGGSRTPALIDNGPGGVVHVVVGDREPGGTGAALFTQLGADGNIRLYGVEDIPAGGFVRPPIFGQAHCTDASSAVAGCVTAQLDPVRATLAPPKIAPDTSAILSGLVKTAQTPSGAAGPARATARKAEIAIQRTSGKRCSWWSPPRRRFVPRSCYKPVFFAVNVTGSRWNVHTGRLGTGPATVWVRGVSGARVQQVFRDGTNKRAVLVKRRLHTRHG
ncbi:MAG TPA: hypothetical protein VMU39_25570 [Solirubrobacteraceae bacterium]|nr:hypothetical protein [Solirubrobacteraceae bacterium]